MEKKTRINADGSITKIGPVDDTREMVSEFQFRVDQALANGEEWVETTPEIIAHYQRDGVGPAGYFLFKGVKVCEQGNVDKILERESMTNEEKMHGKEAGVSSYHENMKNAGA